MKATDDSDMPSSVIRHIDYFSDNMTLRVRFQTGAIYDYHGVPASVYVGLRQSSAKGRYFNKNIAGHFRFERVSQ